MLDKIVPTCAHKEFRHGRIDAEQVVRPPSLFVHFVEGRLRRLQEGSNDMSVKWIAAQYKRQGHHHALKSRPTSDGRHTWHPQANQEEEGRGTTRLC